MAATHLALSSIRNFPFLSFGHAALDVKQADRLLDWAQATIATTVDLTANLRRQHRKVDHAPCRSYSGE
jgi:hypothetical protein